MSFDEVCEFVIGHILANCPPAYVVTPNAQHIVNLQDNARFRSIYDCAVLRVPDGVPLLWAARLLGTPLAGRVNGTDLCIRLCELAAVHELRVFLLGGRPGAAINAASVLTSKFPNLQICGTYCPPAGFETQAAELRKIEDVISHAKPDILLVGLGSPKQEYWIYDHHKNLGVPMSLGIGVSFELIAGVVPRAPQWMQRLGLEWFFRLLAEPLRLWQRYTIGNARFCLIVAVQWFSLRWRQVAGLRYLSK
jgi:N-acetylglucosaminyldiphosphoundecaprenol N-acetyl-beta-D-mannosaminyltransferase